MTLEETRRVIEGYLGDRGGHWLAEDVALSDLAGGESVSGRRQSAERLARVCPETSPRLTVEDGRAAVEWHGGPAAVFEVEVGEIVAARLYLQASSRTIEANREGGN